MRYLPTTSLKLAGFSLVEVSIAMAIAAFALISLVGVLPSAMKGSANGSDQTAIGVMLGDVYDRIEGSLLEVGPIPAPNNEDAFFYDLRGVFVDSTSTQKVDETIITEKFYRVEIELIKPTVPVGSAPGSQVPYGGALAVSVKIFWPIDANGKAVRPDKPGSVITYFTSARTGPAWKLIDPDYEPLIEY